MEARERELMKSLKDLGLFSFKGRRLKEYLIAVSRFLIRGHRKQNQALFRVRELEDGPFYLYTEIFFFYLEIDEILEGLSREIVSCMLFIVLTAKLDVALNNLN